MSHGTPPLEPEYDMITGKTLIEWGHKPGPHFGEMLAYARDREFQHAPKEFIRQELQSWIPPVDTTEKMPLRARGDGPGYFLNLDMEDAAEDGSEDLERENVMSVIRHMDELMRLPTVVAGAVMPDACPAGQFLGTIPVGGVIATRNAIHPGMHSADICCSMAFTNMGHVHPKRVLDIGQAVTHFGPGGRDRGQQLRMPQTLLDSFESNELLAPLLPLAREHFATQGDGNHFFYVGTLGHTGDTVLVTHHGSRAPGAKLFKAGMAIAEGFRKRISPETPKHNAWIPADTYEGRLYWDALQIIRTWTRESHFAIHDRVYELVGNTPSHFARFWNEHNFVFRRDDGLYYHAKGATPMWWDVAPGDGLMTSLRLIPLNMGHPILIVSEKRGGQTGLGFAPHGAGRNMSRTAYIKTLTGNNTKVLDPDALKAIVAEQTKGIDARFYNGSPDVSELPLAYKGADVVRKQIEKYNLAEIEGLIEPYGCIMAGDYKWGAKR